MAVACRFERNGRLFVEEWTGTVTPEEEIEAMREAILDPRYQSGMTGLVDLRQANIPFGESGLRKIFDFRREHGDVHVGWRWAILVRTPQQQVVGSLYTVMTENVPTQISVFQDEDEALHWLGFPRPSD